MVFFNYATMQMAAKIVYYGPGLCGKTTNLHHIYAKTSPQSRGEMVSLETETDRTLFFDLLPIDVGVIGGFKTRLQLYTIPGQVFYNTTRKLVLKGVDGLVFVADSQVAMLDANLESFKNLRENLGEIGLSIDEIPLVLQLNKRDLPNIAPAETVVDVIDPERRFDFVEAVASRGDGVFETLKVISKLTLRTLRRRMTGEEPARPPSRRPVADASSFRVREEPASSEERAAETAQPPIGKKIDTAPIPAFGAVVPAVAAATAPSRAPTEPAATQSVQVVEPIEEISVADEILIELAGIDELSIPDVPRTAAAHHRRASRFRAVTCHSRTGHRFWPERTARQNGARGQTRQGALFGRHHGRARIAAETGDAIDSEAAGEEGNVAARRAAKSAQTETRRPSHDHSSDASRHLAEVETFAHCGIL
jgi:hypothetical protein